MMPGTGLADLVALAFEAACDADGMSGFIEEAAGFFGAQQAALVIWPIRRPSALLPITYQIAADDIRAHFEFRDKPDTLFGKLATLPAGSTFVTEGLSAGPPEQTILAGVVCADEKNRCGILFARDVAHGNYTEHENESLRRLAGYFDRAITLNKRFVGIFNTQKTFLTVLNSAPRGIVAFGQKGQIVHMNSEAKRILGESDGVSISGQSVNFYDEEARQKLHEFFDYARTIGDQETGQERLSTAVKRRSLRSSYQMMVFALPFKQTQADLNEDEALAAMVIYDPSTGVELETEGLKTFYSLSNAEARLAERLCRGQALPDAAGTLSISVNTARSQLRGIFKKVGVQSQGALMKEFAKALKLPNLLG
jgi:DNA-binding CsgD family transcriptional regulator/PAS domain-containing protein